METLIRFIIAVSALSAPLIVGYHLTRDISYRDIFDWIVTWIWGAVVIVVCIVAFLAGYYLTDWVITGHFNNPLNYEMD